ncbi:hypothetical protein PanWU01x14_017850 [Parasponia andersonii]|uniref:Uncharacterized protein n=1 Tax=Parasponia andersonii TaxID=3476 RepID=A0A2P5DZ26_PARAD|nr:hypothetical protein PanWU01x14_017850 [Parasponia andersonii]
MEHSPTLVHICDQVFLGLQVEVVGLGVEGLEEVGLVEVGLGLGVGVGLNSSIGFGNHRHNRQRCYHNNPSSYNRGYHDTRHHLPPIHTGEYLQRQRLGRKEKIRR